MRKVFLFLLLSFISFIGLSQSKGYFPYDSVYLQKVGGTSELILYNATKDSAFGFLMNKGSGRTEFRRVLRKYDSIRYVIGSDTLKLGATNGASMKNGLLVLGNDSGATSATLLSHREIPLNGYNVFLSGNGKLVVGSNKDNGAFSFQNNGETYSGGNIRFGGFISGGSDSKKLVFKNDGDTTQGTIYLNKNGQLNLTGYAANPVNVNRFVVQDYINAQLSGSGSGNGINSVDIRYGPLTLTKDAQAIDANIQSIGQPLRLVSPNGVPILMNAVNTGNVVIGSATDNGNKLQVNGTGSFWDSILINKTSSYPLLNFKASNAPTVGNTTTQSWERYYPLSTGLPFSMGSASTLVNAGDTANSVFTWGQNMGPGVQPIVAGKPALGYSIESWYQPNAGGPVLQEAHMQYVNRAGTQIRPFSYTINTSTQDIDYYNSVSRMYLKMPATNFTYHYWDIATDSSQVKYTMSNKAGSVSLSTLSDKSATISNSYSAGNRNFYLNNSWDFVFLPGMFSSTTYNQLNLNTYPSGDGTTNFGGPANRWNHLDGNIGRFTTGVKVGSYTDNSDPAYGLDINSTSRITGTALFGSTTDNGIGKVQIKGKLTVDSLVAGNSSVDSPVVWNSTTHAFGKIAPGSSSGTPSYIINSKIGDTLYRTTGPGLAANTTQFKGLIAGGGMTNTVTDSTIKYSIGGALTQPTTINTNNFNFNITGGGGTNISTLANTYGVSNSGGGATANNQFYGRFVLIDTAKGLDANVAVTGRTVIFLPAITANRTIQFNGFYPGELCIILNKNNSAFTWSVTGTTLKDATGTTIATLANNTTYIMVYDGTAWNKIN